MRNGDISNDLPKRILVTTDTFVRDYIKIKRRFKFFKVREVDQTIRRDTLSYLYMFTTRRGVTLELVSFNLESDRLDLLYEMLDEMGTNPFRYYTHYDSIEKLVEELPYRPEILGVLDKPTNLLRYGHWGLDESILYEQ